jgi:hypothetical protein
MNATTKSVAPRAPNRARRWGIIVGAGLATVGLAYGVGRLQSTFKMDELRATSERAIEGEQRQSSRLQAELTAERARVTRLEARRRLHLAVAALDDRNFGIAQVELKQAAALLAKAGVEAGTELQKLQSEIAAKKLLASDDVGAQRQHVLGWARRFDQLEPPTEP